MKLNELEEAVNGEEVNPFYISLSDLMILLCVFFAMIVSISNIDKGSFERIRSGVTGSTEDTLVELNQTLQYVAKTPPGVPGVEVGLAADGVRLDLDTAALFDTGSAVLKPQALEMLAPLLRLLLDTEYQIDVEGHTDDVPLHRKRGREIETNWSLSGRRASAVLHHLITYGFSPERVRIVGYADTKPKVDVFDKFGDELERARAENRRVSLLVK